MKSILIVAHGSRREQSNTEVRQLAERMDTRTAADENVSCAFLELAEPSIPDGIQRCIDAGADEVVVLPYFLSAGRHVTEDIPDEVLPKQQQHPEVTISISDYLGSSALLQDAMLQLIEKQENSD